MSDAGSIHSGNPLVGAVMVVGGGIAGMQASLDLAEGGFNQLDKTFPTNDCSM